MDEPNLGSSSMCGRLRDLVCCKNASKYSVEDAHDTIAWVKKTPSVNTEQLEMTPKQPTETATSQSTKNTGKDSTSATDGNTLHRNELNEINATEGSIVKAATVIDSYTESPGYAEISTDVHGDIDEVEAVDGGLSNMTGPDNLQEPSINSSTENKKELQKSDENASEENTSSSSSLVELPPDYPTTSIEDELLIRCFQKDVDIECLKLLIYREILHWGLSGISSVGCKRYIHECVEIAWRMNAQTPPMLPTTNEIVGQAYDSRLHTRLRGGGNAVSQVVWPALYLYEGGPIVKRPIVIVEREDAIQQNTKPPRQDPGCEGGTQSNPRVEDISSAHRSLDVADRFEYELYGERWTDAYEELTGAQDEENVIKVLLDIFMREYEIAARTMDIQLKRISNQLQTTGRTIAELTETDDGYSHHIQELLTVTEDDLGDSTESNYLTAYVEDFVCNILAKAIVEFESDECDEGRASIIGLGRYGILEHG